MLDEMRKRSRWHLPAAFFVPWICLKMGAAGWNICVWSGAHAATGVGIPINDPEHTAQTQLNRSIVKIVRDCIMVRAPGEMSGPVESVVSIVTIAGPG